MRIIINIKKKIDQEELDELLDIIEKYLYYELDLNEQDYEINVEEDEREKELKKINELSDAELLELFYEIWREKHDPITLLLKCNDLVNELRKRGFDVTVEELYERILNITTKAAINPQYLIDLANQVNVKAISTFVFAPGIGPKDWSIYFRVKV